MNDQDRKTRQRIVDLLNEAYRLDPHAMHGLVNCRVSCNSVLADHPTIQVSTTGGGGYHVGLLGILNGIAGTQDGSNMGWIAAVYEDDGGFLQGFKLLGDEGKT